MNSRAVELEDEVMIKVNDIIHEKKENENEIVNSKEVKILSEVKEKNNVVKFIENFIKRFIDICGGIVGVIILIPLTIGIYIISKLIKDEGPIFYTQERIGKKGKLFKMFKYRTMVVGADEILEKYLKENEEARIEYKTYKKLKNDPRITRLGKFLRKTSLDEMPQLINVLFGTMSLVGPRPYLPREKEDMGDYYDIIIKSKPGIGGLWQCRSRSQATFKERLDLDIEYHNNYCLKYDLEILYKTILKVIHKDGAM